MNEIKTTIFILFAALVISMPGCKPEYAEMGEAHSKKEGLNGTWKFSSMNQVDDKSPIKETKDMTSFYVNEDDPFTLTFDAASSTYEVNIPQGKNFFGNGGSWSLDDDFAASKVNFNSPDGITEMELRSVVRFFDNELVLAFTRACDDPTKPYVTYEFTFLRQ